jgi:hypothetical protein
MPNGSGSRPPISFTPELPPVAIAAARETAAPKVEPLTPSRLEKRPLRMSSKINTATYWQKAADRAVAAKR